MKFGVVMFATDYAIRPDEFAKECEDRGFESVWYPEHTHIPASRRSPWPGGGELPKDYWHTHDLFVSLDGCRAPPRQRSRSAVASAWCRSTTRLSSPRKWPR